MLRSKTASRRKTILGSFQAGDCLARNTRSSSGEEEQRDVVQQTPERKRVARSTNDKAEEIVDEDGFRYKKRPKKETPLPPDAVPEYPTKATDTATIQELSTNELPDDPQFLLCYVSETVCNQELELAKQTYGGAGLAHVAKAVEEVLTSFKTGLEEMTQSGGVEFGKAGDVGDEEIPELTTRKDTLRALRDKYAAEEAEWARIKEHYQGDGANASVAEAEAAVHEAAAVAREEVREGSASGALRKACEDAHRKLSLQIEGLEALVRSAEDACRHADRARYQVTARLEQMDTAHLPHVSSPHRLVHQLISVPAAN